MACRKHHLLSATMDVVAKTLKDYADLKVARMEVSQSLGSDLIRALDLGKLFSRFC